MRGFQFVHDANDSIPDPLVERRAGVVFREAGHRRP
jgi:hypothetical protein